MKKILSVLLASVFVTGLLAASAGPAAAHDPTYGATDYCSKVPDTLYGVFDFRHACTHHDYAYRTHWQSKASADSAFYWAMTSHCRNRHAWYSPRLGACLDVRSTYYLGVKYLGLPAWNGRSMFAPMNYVR